MNLVDKAYRRASEVLSSCASPLGFKASGLDTGYPQVWGRDAPITSLGALLTGDAELIAASRASLETLGSSQTDLGMIHLNVDTRTGEVTTENAGAVDANLWFILGHYAYFSATGDMEFLRSSWLALEKALLWLRYQDMNACGLLEIPEAGDWADLYSVRYNALYDNVLYYGALRALSILADKQGRAEDVDGAEPGASASRASTERGTGDQAAVFAALAEDVMERLNLLHWLDRPWDARAFGEQLERLKAMRLEWFLLYQNTATLTEIPYYLPWTGFREFGTVFDGFGNMLAVLFGVASEARTARIFEYAHSAGADHPFPLRAFYPPVYPGEREWREYYRSRNLNLPHQYHNGGIWPFLGGFYVAALVQQGEQARAEQQLELLARANELGKRQKWEFNEWIHGLSGRPMGHPLQAWSAAMYVYAHRAVETGRAEFFDGLRAHGRKGRA
jgi:hypothetical protein